MASRPSRKRKPVITTFNPSPELKGRIIKFVGQDRVDAYIASQPDPWTALYDLAKVVQTISIEAQLQAMQGVR